MLTPRGWWFLLLVLTVAGIGGVLALRGTPALFLISLTLVIWFGAEWAPFFGRARILAPSLIVERVVGDERGPVNTLWAGKHYRVTVTVRLPRGQLPYVVLNDRPPVGATTDDIPRREGVISKAAPATWEYTLRAERPGVVRFEGVRVRLSDLQGFFYEELFIRAPVELTVLPVIAGTGTPRRADKRINLLPPPGVHRHRRPGTGSELLELRDYRPGDPPRRIAWKISARRDQLITREYESEVPLRCTLLIDASNATRLGPPGKTALAGLTDVAATVTQTAIANRDLVGLAVTDEASVDYSAPARTSTQLVTIFETLARTAVRSPEVRAEEISRLLPRALALAGDLYPELMRPRLNRFPAWLPWLSPPPVLLRRVGKAPTTSWVRRWARVFSPRFRARVAARKRLAALIAAKYSLPPGAIALLCEDNPSFARWLQHLLAEHRVPAEVSVYDAAGRDRFADPAPLDRQAAALVRAVSRGRDNELFVLMGEYVERAGRMNQLLKAVRVARARFHQVLVIQSGRIAADDIGPPPTGASLTEVLEYAERGRRARAWHAVRRAFGRLGVPVLPAGEGDPARLILHRLEQLRAAQGTGRT